MRRDAGGYTAGVPPSPFVIPAQPILRDRPPKGDGWLHEVKFDGYRTQLHKAGKAAIIYSKNGRDFSNRFPGIVHALLALSCKNAIIDAEIVALKEDGSADFRALHSGKHRAHLRLHPHEAAALLVIEHTQFARRRRTGRLGFP